MNLARECVKPRYRAIGARSLDRVPQLETLSPERRLDLRVAASVLPFRVNEYVLDELVDWSDIPSDPIYQLVFPQTAMLEPRDASRLRDLVLAGATDEAIRHEARAIQLAMNPHPGGQMDLNVPTIDGVRLSGCQHKYRETVLYFPKGGQTCHAFCTYCFRWPQFVGIERFRFALNEVELLVSYLRRHREVSDVLVTGGDPMIMSSSALRRSVGPLLGPGLDHVTTIRFGTKALATWPYRFTTDRDADDLLRLFEEINASGRQVAIMAHFSHPRELQTRVAREAIRRVRDAGAVVRCQSPLIRHVNDRAETWAELWREEVRLGAVPYYMFVARNTGPHHYFEVPLARCLEIFSDAYVRVCGLARTVRGPVMSATPGKVLIVGVTELDRQKVFVLKMIQGRDPSWVNRMFFARYDPRATWLDDLEPLDGHQESPLDRPGPEPVTCRNEQPRIAPRPRPSADDTRAPDGRNESPGCL